MSADLLCRLENCRVWAGNHLVFEEISANIKQGDRILLTGANGAGKTILLKVLAGQHPVQRGTRVWSTGEAFTDFSASIRKSITLNTVSHEFSQLSTRNRATGLDMVLSGYSSGPLLYREPTTKETENAHRAMRLFRAGHLADRLFVTLSRGEIRKLMLARVFVTPRSIYLLDEIFSGLDRASADNLKAVLAQEVPAQAAVVISAHRPQQLNLNFNAHWHLKEKKLSELSVKAHETNTEPAPGLNFTLPDFSKAPEKYFAMSNARVFVEGNLLFECEHAEIRAGQFIILTGENGSGKSTFLQIIRGFRRADYDSKITWYGERDGTHYEKNTSTILINADSLRLVENTARVEEVILSGNLKKFHSDRECTHEEIAEIRAFARLHGAEHLMNKLYGELSAGEKFKIHVLRALYSKCDLLLIDENEDSFDEQAYGWLFRQIQYMLKAAKSVLLVSHAAHVLPELVTKWEIKNRLVFVTQRLNRAHEDSRV